MADQDRLNTLYVAFTRARESLVVLQKEKQSVFESLALNPLETGRVLPSESPVTKRAVKTLACEPKPYGRQKLEVAKGGYREDFDFEAVDMGSAFHYALEMIGAFDPAFLEDAMTAVANRFVLETERYVQIEAMVRTLLADGGFQKLVQGEIYKERPFIQNGEVGVIDLYAVDGDVVRVVDYKTGSARSGYREQVQRYMDALRPHYPDKRIEGYLCYVCPDRVTIEAL